MRGFTSNFTIILEFSLQFCRNEKYKKAKIEHTQKPLTSFKMWVLCDKKEAQIPPIRAEKEREEK